MKALLDLESIKLDGDNLLGLDTQLEKLKEDASYLFDEKTDDTKLKASSGADHQNPPNQKKVERSSYYKLKSFSRSC